MKIIGIILGFVIVFWITYIHEKKERAEKKALKIAFERWITELKKEGLTIIKYGKDYPNYEILGKNEWLYDQSLGPVYGVEEVEEFVYFKEYQKFKDLLFQFEEEELQKIHYPKEVKYPGYKKMSKNPKWPKTEAYELIDKNDHTKTPMFFKLKKD